MAFPAFHRKTPKKHLSLNTGKLPPAVYQHSINKAQVHYHGSTSIDVRIKNNFIPLYKNILARYPARTAPLLRIIFHWRLNYSPEHVRCINTVPCQSGKNMPREIKNIIRVQQHG